ncbi:MAG: DUF2520 domain-containing protein [Bacteroidales bacterium]
MKIVLIGAGNVGFHLAQILCKGGHELVQIIDHKMETAAELASIVSTSEYTTKIKEINKNADLYLLCVRDENLLHLAEDLQLFGKVVVHVSGSVPLKILKEVSTHYGVLYFLQTFTKLAQQPDLSSTPICVEASDNYTKDILLQLASSISSNVCYTSSEDRLVIHLSAVFACNYSNFMYTIAYNLLKEKGLDFHLLLPLIEETVHKIQKMPPESAQTGPAVRGDKVVLDKHLQALKQMESGRIYENLYKILSEFLYKEK